MKPSSRSSTFTLAHCISAPITGLEIDQEQEFASCEVYLNGDGSLWCAIWYLVTFPSAITLAGPKSTPFNLWVNCMRDYSINNKSVVIEIDDLQN